MLPPQETGDAVSNASNMTEREAETGIFTMLSLKEAVH